MKYLEFPGLTFLQSTLSGLESADHRLHFLVECFSCKSAGDEKKLAVCLDRFLDEQESLQSGLSPFGPLCLRTSRQTLINLIATLSLTFPDYDFRHVKPTQFQKELDLSIVKNFVDGNLAEIVEEYAPEFRDLLWKTIGTVIDLSGCDLYSFSPDAEADPFTDEGCIWSFNYFFYNRAAKKILFMTARCVSKHALAAEDNASESGESFGARIEREDDDDTISMGAGVSLETMDPPTATVNEGSSSSNSPMEVTFPTRTTALGAGVGPTVAAMLMPAPPTRPAVPSVDFTGAMQTPAATAPTGPIFFSPQVPPPPAGGMSFIPLTRTISGSSAAPMPRGGPVPIPIPIPTAAQLCK
ncbi:putative Mod5 protein sorting/negative effector of RNA Pol III synthesis [Paratrimastix pyriformis]|uniref:Mod5 protein sorting/negative effector of RNA Pol III synthesis n=1 Tax=Paratrimastix pyriformis TaxID=342808 RepID=A0ABQ8U9D3_9EUKA|nr:putative Mod5 protein sorting/negative effector of RNA Pol III synthesis [Paratrimastix pyriformis]|eukprot:GAFH01001766.1.p1 GENE.GAFH01001766.1~~GAFH01001766.1.p1  ORF type:complete len:355 (-),score=21.67 GAFH01001766.1:327-1391(-)